MIKFKNVVLKNFLSIGDNPLTLQLDRNPTTLITGANAVGKSSILCDSLTFVLFGKSYRGINKPALINTVNQRDSVVEITFTKGTDSYKIIRGQKPARLEVYKNDAILNEEAAIRDMQTHIENDILGFDFSSFVRVCVLSTMNYTPFMQLSAHERRNLVENMLSLRVFSEMSKQHKQNASNIKDQIVSLQTDLQVKRTKYEERFKTLQLVEQIDEDRAKLLKDQLKQLGDSLDIKEKEIAELEHALAQVDASNMALDAENLKQTILELQKNIRELEVENNIAEKKRRFYDEHTTCDQCTQDINPELANRVQEECEHQIKHHLVKIDVLKHELELTSERLDKTKETLNSIAEVTSSLDYARKSRQILVADIRKKYEELTDKSKASQDSSRIREEVNQLKGQLKYIAGKFEEVSDRKDTLVLTTELLKDTGIKAGIIKQYIPLLVGYVNHYLEQLNISIKFSMDENFNESITTRYAKEYTYSNLSMGERGRLDLAIAFAWRQIAKLKGSVYCNILILDEVLDASLDINGTEDALGILEDICHDTSVFIISHKANLDEKVRSVIRLEKVNGFTKIL